MREEGTFDHSDIFQICRHVVLGKDPFNIWEISRGPFQPEDNLRLIPKQEQQLFL